MPTIKLRLPSNKTLGNLCVYGAIASISAVMYMRWKLEDRVRSQDYYKLALQTLRQHKGAVGLLGEPIKETGFDISNSHNSCNADQAQFEVKIKGAKDKGMVYFWARNDSQRGWLIDRLEMELKQHPNKRFLLKKEDARKTPTNVDQNQMDIKTVPTTVQQPLSTNHQPTESEQQSENFVILQQRNYTPLQQPEPDAFIQTAEGGSMH